VRRSLRVVLLGAVAFVIALIIVFPASWLRRALPAGTQCASWNGSLWRGQCTGLAWSAPGAPPVQLDSLSWRVHPLALLRARLALDAELNGAGWRASGKVLLGRGNLLHVEDLSATGLLDRNLLGALPAGWKARFEARAIALELRDRTLQQIGGTLTARELTDAQGTRLGDYQLQFAPQASAPFTGNLRDLGGPIALAAQLTIKADRAWMLDGTASLRPGSPPQLARLLDQFNTADLSGRRRILLEGVVD
jgi:hypothetical protein